MEINFLKRKKIFFAVSAIASLMSVISLALFGLNAGIDFTGGSILEIRYEDRPEINEIKEKLAGLDLGDFHPQPAGDNNVLLRMKDISEETHQEILSRLQGAEELKFESIGPVIGMELKEKTRFVALLSIFAIVLYIAFAFRKLSWPAKSWEYGIVSLAALFHDILLPLGLFAFLGKFYGIQITIPVIVALLTVLGYSINNTVVVFDRIREKVLKNPRGDYEDMVNRSLNETLSRSLGTSFTTLLVLFAIFFFGGETLKYFSLALISGIIAGTYSSLFLVSPLLVMWLKSRRRI